MQRRAWLQGMGLVALEPLLFSCNSNSAEQLRVRWLRGSLPLSLVREFRRQFPSADFQVFDQLATVATKLQDWRSPSPDDSGWRWPGQAATPVLPPDLVTIGHSWLPAAIAQQELQPLMAQNLARWPQLDRSWQDLVTVKQQVWAAPYRWGSTVLLYRADLLKRHKIPAPQDWADLWRPELRGRVVLFDRPQETIGVVLKKLGHKYATPLKQVPNLEAQLRQLHQQALFYSSDNYISPLLTGDAWVAMAWSGDAAVALPKQTNLAVAVPQSGTSLWADCWVRPLRATANQTKVGDRWIDFCWQPSAVAKIAALNGGVSPYTSRPVDRNFVDPQILARGEFLFPLADATRAEYLALWRSVVPLKTAQSA